jgi:hypothetical protein
MRKSANRRPYRATRIKLSAQPWKISTVFDPIERILHRLEADCTVDSAQGRPVFYEDSHRGWYDLVEALRGLIDFHQIAETRHGIAADTDGLIRFANKLHSSAPIFEQDLAQVRADIDTCKRQALRLTIDEATDIVQTIRISMELDKIKPAPAAHSERSAQAVGKTAPGAGTSQQINHKEQP